MNIGNIINKKRQFLADQEKRVNSIIKSETFIIARQNCKKKTLHFYYEYFTLYLHVESKSISKYFYNNFYQLV